MRTTFSTCVRHGEYAYGFDDVNLKCLDLRTGKATWKEYGFDKGSLTIADGRLIILSANGTLVGSITNTYDGDSNLVTSTDGDGNVTQYTYNAANQVLTTSVYDAGGNLVSFRLEILDASKRVTEAHRIEFQTVG